MTVGELKKYLSEYSDDALFVVHETNMDCVYDNSEGFYDMWIEGENERLFGPSWVDKIINPDSKVVSLKIFR